MGDLKRNANTARGRRMLKKRESKIVEGEKKAIFLKSPTASNVVRTALTDLNTHKAPNGKLLTREKNPIHPFDDASSIEFLCKVNDSSLFMVGTDSKKRPHTITMGRTFDFQILDMMEFQMNPNTFKSIKDLSANRSSISRVGAERMMLFIGEIFDSDEDMKSTKSLMLDFFRAQELTKVNLAGLDSIMVVTATANPSDSSKKFVFFRHYSILKKKSGTRVPRVVLEEVGPRIDFSYNRATKGSSEIMKAAYKSHHAAKEGKKKNVEIGQLGQQLGRVHMEKQDFNQMALAKLKGLGKRYNPNSKRKADDDEDADPAAALFANDYDKTEQRSKKRAKALPAAYTNSIISE